MTRSHSDGVSEYDFTTNTGLMNLDYLNGQIVPLDNGDKQLYTGLSNGRIVMCIGKSGTGKSTMAMQIGANIIQNYENGLLYLFDFEQNNTKERFRMVTGVTEEYLMSTAPFLEMELQLKVFLDFLAKLRN